ncbi:hypothetical protein [Amniculibacterium sp. G2-70]|uniref:hypothetical protein n=1 Tax=Amniculibacterium sp. G2-70 TaxID=2767188 RepID=UPI00165405A7|nr:hypothetical protein [Amniculibacterium sp. G2-70]
MKKFQIIFTILPIIVLLIHSCKSIQNQDSFIEQFFYNQRTHYELNDYYGDKVIIYDENKIFTNTETLYELDKTSIKVQTNLPLEDSFFRIHDFVLNKDLAFVALTTSDRLQGIMIFLKRNSKTNKWNIIEVRKKPTR